MKRSLIFAFIALACAAIPSLAPAGAATSPHGQKTAVYPFVTYPNAAFNGKLRLTPSYYGPPGRGAITGEPPLDRQQRVIVFDAALVNESSSSYTDRPDVRLVDRDGIAADTRRAVPEYVSLHAGGGAASLHVVFWVPKDFVPYRVTFACEQVACKPMGITLAR